MKLKFYKSNGIFYRSHFFLYEKFSCCSDNGMWFCPKLPIYEQPKQVDEMDREDACKCKPCILRGFDESGQCWDPRLKEEEIDINVYQTVFLIGETRIED